MVLLHVGDERRLQLLIVQLLPVQLSQPGVLLYLLYPSVPQPHKRLPLNQLIHEIHRMTAPSRRSLSWLYLRLSC